MTAFGDLEMKCAICGTFSNVDWFPTTTTDEDGNTVSVRLPACSGRGKKIVPTSCAGMLTTGEIHTKEWQPGTLRFRLSEKAAKAVNTRGGGRHDGLGYFIHAPRTVNANG